MSTTEIRLLPPVVTGHAVRFAWTIDPPSEIYQRHDFEYVFPEHLDLGRVPERVWWWIALMILHPHWVILHPCTVVLPVSFGEAELAFWARIIATDAETLDTYRGVTAGGSVRLVDGTTPLTPLPSPANVTGGRAATAFSGGKDSLLQAGLLAEFTPRPLLVTVTSPLPPMEDHISPRRHEILDAIGTRTDMELVEVHADVRASWNNQWPRSLGYPVSVNEMSDTFVYLGALLAVALATGVTDIYLASEIEVNSNIEIGGRFVQHPHFMYSVVTLGALAALIEPSGISLGSLTPPLYSFQVQHLLWKRYPELRGHQFSCWRVAGEERVCNACSQCLRIGFLALAGGFSPAEMGIDVARLLKTQGGWRPRLTDPAAAVTPEQVTALAHHSATVDAIRRVGTLRLLREVVGDRPSPARLSKAVTAIRRLRSFKADLRDYRVLPPSGYRPGMLVFVGPLSPQVERVYADTFAAEPLGTYQDQVARAQARIDWIAEPLRADWTRA